MSKNPPRLITTKAGYEAEPNTPEIGKSFDSNWFDGGGIRWVLNANRSSGQRINFPYTLTRPPVVTPVYDRVWTDDYWAFHLFMYDSTLFPSFGWPNPPKNVARIRTNTEVGYQNPAEVTSSYLVAPTYNPDNPSNERSQPDKYIVWSL